MLKLLLLVLARCQMNRPGIPTHQIGVVDQEPVLFAGSIADNIRYGVPSATNEQVEEAARQVRAVLFCSSTYPIYRSYSSWSANICFVPGFESFHAEKGVIRKDVSCGAIAAGLSMVLPVDLKGCDAAMAKEAGLSEILESLVV